MHNEFYASGFLYHPASQQILLQQKFSNYQIAPHWSLFGGKNRAEETSNQAFLRILSEKLGLSLSHDTCFTVYDYLQKENRTPHFIFYSVVDDLYDEDALLTANKTSWFTFKQITKLAMKPQTRQDITVGQRVINLAIRQLLPPAPTPES